MNTTTLFSGRADHYAKGRPAYAETLIDFLFNRVGLSPESVVADVGAGTGIFSRQLLEQGCGVICVEPNRDMRAAARQKLSAFPKAVFLDGSAENTSLPDGAVDFITAAQAFHWFDTKTFQTESRRVLKPGGIAMLIWNFRDTESPFGAAYQSIFKTYCPNYKGFSGGLQPDDPRIQQYFNGQYQCAAFDHPIVYDKATFLSRALSSSYSLTPGDARYEDYLHALEQLFDAYAVEGSVTVPNRSVLYWGQP